MQREKTKKAQKKQKKSKEVEVLQINKDILSLEKNKMKNKEEKIILHKEMINVLNKINANIEKLIPTPFQMLMSQNSNLLSYLH